MLKKAFSNVIDVGIVPTAAVSFLTVHHKAAMGIMVTASHNPPEYNGIKIFNPDGSKLGSDDKARIEELIACPWVERLVSHFKDIKEWPRVAVDCANGAGAGVTREVFSRLGVSHMLYNTSGEINPKFELPIGDADIGFAFDGDADRLTVVGVHGDRLLAALALYLCKRGDSIAVTQMFNMGAEKFLAEHGIGVIRTEVGDANVAAVIRKHGLRFGGESSGHIIIPKIHIGGDGLTAALTVMRMIVESGKSIDELTRGIPLLPFASANVPSDVVIKHIERPGYRIVVRKSGTEPVTRLYVEGPDERTCKTILNNL